MNTEEDEMNLLPDDDYDFYPTTTRLGKPPQIIHEDPSTIGKRRRTNGSTPIPVTHQNLPNPVTNHDVPMNEKKTRTRSGPKPPNIKYNITEDVLTRKADIEVGDLIAASPYLKKQLRDVCRPTRQRQSVPLNSIENGEVVTTAAYAEVHINNRRIKALVDCGAAKSCMSRSMMNVLGMEIDTPSTSVFTLGNGTKQPTLGVILDVPIRIGDAINIPADMEILPQCPAHLILGIDWLNRSQAIINMKLGTLTVSYKQKRMVIPITYIKSTSKPVTMKASRIIYEEESLPRRSQAAQHTPSIEDKETDDEDESEDEETEDEEWEHDDKEEEEEEEENQELCQIMATKHPDQTLKVDHVSETQVIISTKDNGFTLPPYTMCTVDLTESNENTVPLIIHIQPEVTYDEYLHDNQLIDVNMTDQDKEYPPNTIIAHRMTKMEEEVDDEQTMGYELAQMEYHEEDIKYPQKPLDPDKQEKIQLGEIPPDIRESFMQILTEFQDVFDWHNDKMGRTTLLEHEIILKENTIPIRHRPYRMAPIEQEYLKKELDKLCQLGIIKPANTPFTAPIILVKKKNGDYRMVVDYRKLNAQTKVDAYPLPKIDDLIDELGTSCIFTALDLRSGFHQVPLKEDSKEMTGFVTKFGTYQYEMLPMGLVNSPATFQRLIDICFGSLINKCLVAYIDDLNIHSKTYQQHLKDLRQVFVCARQGGLLFNIDKCHFFKDELKFLGYIITTNGVKTDEEKIKKIQDFPRPKSLKQIRSFIGLASYYRRFIQNFAAIARPLHDLTKTTKTIEWSQKATDSFETLKQKLIHAPVLTRADFTKPFIIVCDASQKGLGTILSQLDENGKEHPVIYASRGLKNSEQNYGATKLECLALIWSLQMFRPYLLGKKFTVISDHSPLRWLVQSPKITGIVARWIQYLAEYDFEIQYRSGRKQEAADFLSRLGY
jgi:hypothetical protein